MAKKSLGSKVSEKHAALRKEIKSGKIKNYYINKEGKIIQKITIHLPYDMVIRLKKEAIDQRLSLSELIRRRLYKLENS